MEHVGKMEVGAHYSSKSEDYGHLLTQILLTISIIYLICIIDVGEVYQGVLTIFTKATRIKIRISGEISLVEMFYIDEL